MGRGKTENWDSPLIFMTQAFPDTVCEAQIHIYIMYVKSATSSEFVMVAAVM